MHQRLKTFLPYLLTRVLHERIIYNLLIHVHSFFLDITTKIHYKQIGFRILEEVPYLDIGRYVLSNTAFPERLIGKFPILFIAVMINVPFGITIETGPFLL